jgi:hypothetical protein
MVMDSQQKKWTVANRRAKPGESEKQRRRSEVDERPSSRDEACIDATLHVDRRHDQGCTTGQYTSAAVADTLMEHRRERIGDDADGR